MSKTITIIALFVALIVPASALAKTKDYYAGNGRCRVGYVKHYVKAAKRKHGRIVRRDHKVVYVRRLECVVKAKTKTTAAATPTVVRASIDPSYTQDPSDNLKVTWTYSASDTSGDLPDGTLSLSVQEPNTAGSSGGCSIDVGANATGGTCTQELPHYGDWNVTVSYVGASTTVAPVTSTDTEDIEALPVAPVAPTATTTSLSASAGTTYTEQGPPPLNWVEYYGSWGIDMASSDPVNGSYVLSLTISESKTSQTITGSPVYVPDLTSTSGSSMSCALVFTKTVGYNADPSTTIGGCGIPDTTLATGDTLSVSATSAASPGYLPATSSTVALTSPWTL